MTKLDYDIECEQLFILNELQNGNVRAFDVIFNEYYNSLSRFSFSFVKDQSKAEGIVQEVFIKLWEKRSSLVNIDNLFSYLMTMVRNQSIDHLRKEKSQMKVYKNITTEESVNTTEEQISRNEFEEKLLLTIYKLPERCRIAFEMSRFDGCSNKEIAQKMQISIKGVEALIGRSLKFLRAELKEFLPAQTIKENKRAGTVLLSLFVKNLNWMGFPTKVF